MNELTRELVIEVATKHRNTIIKHGVGAIGWTLQAHYENHMIAKYAVDLKFRAMEIYRWFHPEYFDSEGYLHEFADMVFDVDNQLSSMAIRVLWRRVRRDPALQLSDGWGELAQFTAQPQLSLF